MTYLGHIPRTVQRSLATNRRCRRVAPTLAAILAVASSSTDAAGAEEDFAPQAALFAYDAAASLGVREVAVEKRGTVTVRDVTFVAAPGREPIRAYLVEPDGPGPFAGVLWVHWLGEPESTNRTQYLAEAVGLAPKGVVSLLVDAMWSAAGWYNARVPEEDYENSVRQVVALRRAMDLLASQPRVDRARLGFVGHDYGGMYGMILAGLDRRAKTYVYVAVAPSLSHWAFFARQPRSKTEYLRRNAPLELTDYLRQVENASTLFQFADKDTYVSRADTAVLLAAASSPKERKFYDAEHSMSPPAVAADRAAWLVRELVTGAASPLPAPSTSR